MLSLPVRCFAAKLPDEHHFSFGDEHREYMQRTGRFLSRFTRSS